MSSAASGEMESTRPPARARNDPRGARAYRDRTWNPDLEREHERELELDREPELELELDPGRDRDRDLDSEPGRGGVALRATVIPCRERCAHTRCVKGRNTRR
jgi:hypothetical protein